MNTIPLNFFNFNPQFTSFSPLLHLNPNPLEDTLIFER